MLCPLQEKSLGYWRKKASHSWSWSLCPWMACELVVGTENLYLGSDAACGVGQCLVPSFLPRLLLVDSRPPHSLAGAQEWLSYSVKAEPSLEAI